MAAFRWLRTSGSTATLLVTDVAPDNTVMLNAYRRHDYAPNRDIDGDGAPDAVAAGFTYPTTDATFEYGVFLGDPTAPGTPFAIVIDRSHGSADTTYGNDRYVGRVGAYLGSGGRDEIDVGFAQLAASGNGGDDAIRATAGDDVLNGDAGNDLLVGRDGRDLLRGGTGDDVIVGGAGRDRASGGDGADRFVFAPDAIEDGDVIRDFDGDAGDRMDLSAFAPGLTFIGDDVFSGGGAEVRVRETGDVTRLIFDLDGDAIADGAIVLLGAVPIGAGELILPVAPG